MRVWKTEKSRAWKVKSKSPSQFFFLQEENRKRRKRKGRRKQEEAKRKGSKERKCKEKTVLRKNMRKHWHAQIRELGELN